jgi:predicted PurR-regulated permease PerM
MNPENHAPETSPPWSTTAKAIFGVLGLLLLGVLAVRLRIVLTMFLLSLILTFLITPFIRWLQKRARFSWTIATNICFLFLILIILVTSTAAGLVVVQQFQSLFQAMQNFFIDLSNRIEDASQLMVEIGPWVIDFSQFNIGTPFEQALTYLELVIGRASAILPDLATGAVETVVRIVFTLAVAYFLALDYERLRHVWNNLSIPGYELDFKRLRAALSNLWNLFLRGQLAIVTITGVLTWLLMSILGVRFSLGLGVLGGIAKFVPMVGGIAAIVAILQPDNWFNLTPVAHALLVILCVILLDQSIDYLIIPRVMGTSLNLHPVLIIVGALLGATLAGILGLLLSAPALATVILLGKYIYRKMVDQSPWDPPIDEFPEIKERTLGRFLRRRKEIAQEEDHN